MTIPASFPSLFWPMALGFLGALLGSFIATAIGRWRTGRPICVDRSRCDHCRATLTPFELVPLLSAVMLRFRCRRCAAPIGAIHWRVETSACLVGLIAGLATPGIRMATGALFGWQLLALAAFDIRHYTLPNVLTAALAITGLVASMGGIGPAPLDSLLGGATAFGALWVVKAVYRTLRGREGLGGGDPKLFGGIGCWLGWQPLPYVLLGASLVGLAIATFSIGRSHGPLAHQKLPFGACLALAAFPAWWIADTLTY